MAGCIWNDRCYKSIEGGGEYDSSEFTPVRKLFVRWNTDGSNAEDEISLAFRSFGEVESIEIVNDEASTHTNNYGEFPVTHEAYVTFVEHKDVFGALESQFGVQNLVFLVPADTWRQPDYKESDNLIVGTTVDHTSGMDTITREVNILSMDQNSEEVLCEQPEPEFELELKSGTTLDNVRKTLRGMMPFVGDLTLKYVADLDSFTKADDEIYIDNCLFHQRVTEVIGKEAHGPKFKKLTIEGLGRITMPMCECFAPIFQPLTDLTISTGHCNILYLLPSLCPNLVSLRISGYEWEGVGGDVPFQSWPTLKELAVGEISLDVDSDTTTGKRFRDFVSLNPQLNKLEMNVIVDNLLLKAIVESMQSLKSLSLVRESFDGVGGMLDELVRFDNLESIYVNTMYLTTNHFESLLSCVERLSKEEGLKMVTLKQNYILDEDESDVIDGGLPIKLHADCSCHGENRVIAFNDESQNDCVDLPKHKPVLAILVNVARHLKLADSTLDSRIRTLFEATKKFYPNVLKTTVVEEPDRVIYIHISSIDSGN